MSILKVDRVTKRFGGLVAVNDVTMEIQKGEILGLIGPNGAGKTTLTNLISGVHLVSEGKIVFEGTDITLLPAHKRCKLGIARTFQIARPLKNLTVVENIMIGGLFGKGENLKTGRKSALELCEGIGLKKPDETLDRITVLDIKKMEIARAMATNPKILFLDEVMSGLNMDETRDMIYTVRKIRDTGVTICIIEHVMSVIRELTERVIVLDRGEIIAEGPYSVVSMQHNVISAYLGEDA
ncbi:MAG TPA: ABC transporter ATP-binding protein [Mesotoga infera]|mgnify:CR=1 FL=1|jgi:branched-chain amino acid transport system ATP-binding protein|uniref:ABC-type branched-chain amino acid transport systems, ATPase component n=1 Tax=Mesotoga infera TaxID=1236046 RepID=A0A7Z7LH99_9BACT|nr:ABC transporter ATP-binding protein [Mesotoga infera]MBP8660353.1 ABC transporter ATP-binding protein [Mesotoga sp.]NLI06672.1 ABC transporter ATP-binding protein [Thermotogaceae bacterium]SSC13943.1 ABC-type branched-chain amino acid transport systems, ATPase component [Mesotoga infera]HNR79732.1 ABC transporter ATP-binding protein [Mesotoga infera]HNS66291.1 ABC transporter ATP-binding protein [Mesotoga infera]